MLRCSFRGRIFGNLIGSCRWGGILPPGCLPIGRARPHLQNSARKSRTLFTTTGPPPLGKPLATESFAPGPGCMVPHGCPRVHQAKLTSTPSRLAPPPSNSSSSERSSFASCFTRFDKAHPVGKGTACVRNAADGATDCRSAMPRKYPPTRSGTRNCAMGWSKPRERRSRVRDMTRKPGRVHS